MDAVLVEGWIIRGSFFAWFGHLELLKNRKSHCKAKQEETKIACELLQQKSKTAHSDLRV
jgi:hypothetical protein